MIKKQTYDQGGFHIIELVLVIVVLGGIGLVGWFVWQRQAHMVTGSKVVTKNGVTYDETTSQKLTHGQCSGSGSVKIVPPMKLDQVSFVLPYGLMVGGHVTPVDHQYYNGLDVHALRDTYDVVAPADGHLVEITHRGSRTNTPLHSVDIPSSDEYRLVFAHTCSFLTYVDLVTSLDDSIKSQLPAGWNPQNSPGVNIAVKQGQVIGHIGGQTLDFAVWDLSRPLKGFSNTTAYANAEPWKPYTAPTTDYLEPSIKDATVAKYIRTAVPIDGKIDYDQDGKLIGTWFAEGTNGYLGGETQGGRPGYWAGHLSFAPDYLDPSVFVISVGNFSDSFWVNTGANDPGSASDSSAKQFWVKGNAPNPATVTASSGLVKYELVQNAMYLEPSGASWDASHLVKGVTASVGSSVQGVMLVQILEKHKLKVEAFPGKTGSQVSAFDSHAKVYTRGDDAHFIESNTAH